MDLELINLFILDDELTLLPKQSVEAFFTNDKALLWTYPPKNQKILVELVVSILIDAPVKLRLDQPVKLRLDPPVKTTSRSAGEVNGISPTSGPWVQEDRGRAEDLIGAAMVILAMLESREAP
ncbi:hypothetical protein Bca101_070506 [Brassica carinata]